MRSILIFILGLMIGIVTGYLGMRMMTVVPADHDHSAHEHEGEDAPPAFMVVNGTINDRDAFLEGYVSKLAPIYEKYGGTYVAAGRNFEVLEGEGDFQSYVISKWHNMEEAREFWNSPEYDALRNARIANNWGTFDVILYEGLEEAGSTPPAAR